MESQTQIAQKQNELEIKRAELKITADTKKAEAEAAYEIQNQAQEKIIGTATVDAEIAKKREAELKKREVEVAKRAAGAWGPRPRRALPARSRRPRPPCSSSKDAEAKRYEQEQEAEAVKKQAEAARFARSRGRRHLRCG